MSAFCNNETCEEHRKGSFIPIQTRLFDLLLEITFQSCADCRRIMCANLESSRIQK